MADALRAHAKSASNWELLKVGEVAQRLYAPFGTRIALHQEIQICQAFVKLFSTVTTTEVS